MSAPGSKQGFPISERIYQWLLWAYPSDFRRAHGAEMARLFRESLREETRRRGRLGLVRLWLLAVPDVIVNAALTRTDSLAKVWTRKDPSSGGAPPERRRKRSVAEMMESLWQDLHYGVRILIKNPGVTSVAVITLALGIGANTAIFSVVNAVLLRPLPYRDAAQLMTLWQINTKSGVKEEGAAPGNFYDWRDQSQTCTEMAAALPYSHNLTGQGEPEAFRSWLVTAGFFQTLGVNAFLGRTFLPEEYQPGNDRVIVIGDGLWQRRFGADPNMVGQKLLLNGQPHIVVGIMPPEFQFPTGREMWAPRIVTEGDKRTRGSGYMPVIARLKPGATVAQAQHEMDAIAARLAREYPEANLDRGVTIVPLPEQLFGQVRPALLVLLGAVALVLLIACANVANLLLMRAAEREREFAVRSALGAARVRLIRQLLTESILLALLGGLGGVLLAHWGTRAILALSPGNLPRAAEVSIDGYVFGFMLGVSILTALIFGLAPALQFSKPDLNESLKEGGRGTRGLIRHRLRNALVVSEIALALMLLVGAGLLMRSFVRLLQVNPGFAADKALALEVHVWGLSRTAEQRAAFFEQTLNRIAALPGVEAAGAVSALPFHDNPISPNTAFTIEGRPAPAQGQEPTAYMTVTTADYFKALGIPLRRGRFYTKFDHRDTPPVVLINETLARRYWPNEDPVGKKIAARLFGQNIAVEIIGIVGDVRQMGLESDPRPELFVPHLQNPYGSMTYVVRTAADPLTLLPAVKQEIWAVNKYLPFSSTSTIEQLVSRSLGERRFNLLLLGSFALIALALAAVGIYGLISFSTRQRTHEIGTRMALGARPSDILKLVVGQGSVLVLAGVAIGLVGALAITRVMSGLLFGVSATDPLTFAVIALLLIAVALVACYLPARRATKVDPLVALRYE
jgi:putative ABC transport system permease protein